MLQELEGEDLDIGLAANQKMMMRNPARFDLTNMYFNECNYKVL